MELPCSPITPSTIIPKRTDFSWKWALTGRPHGGLLNFPLRSLQKTWTFEFAQAETLKKLSKLIMTDNLHLESEWYFHKM